MISATPSRFYRAGRRRSAQHPGPANTRKQFVESPDLSDAVTDAVLGNTDSHGRMADLYLNDQARKEQLVKLLGELVHETLKAEAS